MAAPDQIASLESALDKSLSGNELSEVKRILYGRELPSLDLPTGAIKRAQDLDFELAGYAFDQAVKESTRPERKVVIGLIQNKIVKVANTTLVVGTFFRPIIPMYVSVCRELMKTCWSSATLCSPVSAR